MGNQVAVKSDMKIINLELGQLTTQIAAELASHIPVERFKRTVLTAIQNTPELLECDRRSIWKACLQAAHDGLYPDGKEGAIVVRWSPSGKQAAWQPMIAGIRKKAQNAGQLSTWDVHAVYANDAFEYEKGDDPFIRHKPALKNRGELIAAYSIATLKDGSKSREVMGIDEIDEIRDQFSTAWQAFAKGKIRSTPWQTARGEMAKKTVGHRHAKVLPLSSDIRELLIKGDDLRTGDAESLPAPDHSKARLTIADQFDALASEGDPSPLNTDTIDGVTGEILDGTATTTTESSGDDRKSSETPSDDLGRSDGEQGAGASTSSQTAPAPTSQAEPAKGKAKDDDKRAAKLAALLDVGDKVAAREGYPGVKDWIEDLSGSQVALIIPDHHDRWKAVAKEAGKPVD